MDAEGRYDVRDVLGKGAFGDVFLVVEKESKQRYVLKRIKMARQSEWQRKATKQEIEIVSRLHHPYIMPYKEHWVHGGHTINVVYGYCEKGDLTTAMAKLKGKSFPEETLRLWLAQLMLGVDYMHKQQVLHRDIKTQNILLTGDGDVQIGDFGLSTMRHNRSSTSGQDGGPGDGEGLTLDVGAGAQLDQQAPGTPEMPGTPQGDGGDLGGVGPGVGVAAVPGHLLTEDLKGTLNDYALVGTPHFMSPELLSNQKYGYATDIWSLGVVMFELTTSKPPFNAFNLAGLVAKIKRAALPPVPSTYSPEWTNVLKSMLRKDPARRATALEILGMPCMAAALQQAVTRARAVDPHVEVPEVPLYVPPPLTPTPDLTPHGRTSGSGQGEGEDGGEGFAGFSLAGGAAAGAGAEGGAGGAGRPTPSAAGRAAVTPVLVKGLGAGGEGGEAGGEDEPSPLSKFPNLDAAKGAGRSPLPARGGAPGGGAGAADAGQQGTKATPGSRARPQSQPRGPVSAMGGGAAAAAAAKRHATPPGRTLAGAAAAAAATATPPGARARAAPARAAGAGDTKADQDDSGGGAAAPATAAAAATPTGTASSVPGASRLLRKPSMTREAAGRRVSNPGLPVIREGQAAAVGAAAEAGSQAGGTLGGAAAGAAGGAATASAEAGAAAAAAAAAKRDPTPTRAAAAGAGAAAGAAAPAAAASTPGATSAAPGMGRTTSRNRMEPHATPTSTAAARAAALSGVSSRRRSMDTGAPRVGAAATAAASASTAAEATPSAAVAAAAARTAPPLPVPPIIAPSPAGADPVPEEGATPDAKAASEAGPSSAPTTPNSTATTPTRSPGAAGAPALNGPASRPNPAAAGRRRSSAGGTGAGIGRHPARSPGSASAATPSILAGAGATAGRASTPPATSPTAAAGAAAASAAPATPAAATRGATPSAGAKRSAPASGGGAAASASVTRGRAIVQPSPARVPTGVRRSTPGAAAAAHGPLAGRDTAAAAAGAAAVRQPGGKVRRLSYSRYGTTVEPPPRRAAGSAGAGSASAAAAGAAAAAVAAAAGAADGAQDAAVPMEVEGGASAGAAAAAAGAAAAADAAEALGRGTATSLGGAGITAEDSELSLPSSSHPRYGSLGGGPLDGPEHSAGSPSPSPGLSPGAQDGAPYPAAGSTAGGSGGGAGGEAGGGGDGDHLWTNTLYANGLAGSSAALAGMGSLVEGTPSPRDSSTNPLAASGSGMLSDLPRRVSISAFTPHLAAAAAAAALAEPGGPPGGSGGSGGRGSGARNIPRRLDVRQSIDVITPPNFKPLCDEDVAPFNKAVETAAAALHGSPAPGTPATAAGTPPANAAYAPSPGTSLSSVFTPSPGASEDTAGQPSAGARQHAQHAHQAPYYMHYPDHPAHHQSPHAHPHSPTHSPTHSHPRSHPHPHPLRDSGSGSGSDQTHSLVTVGPAAPSPTAGGAAAGEGSCGSPSATSAQRSFAGFHVHQPPSPSAWPQPHAASGGGVCPATITADSTDSDAATSTPPTRSPCRLLRAQLEAERAMGSVEEGGEDEEDGDGAQSRREAEAGGGGAADEAQEAGAGAGVAAGGAGGGAGGAVGGTERARLVQLERMVSLCQGLFEQGRLMELGAVLSSTANRGLKPPDWVKAACAGGGGGGSAGPTSAPATTTPGSGRMGSVGRGASGGGAAVRGRRTSGFGGTATPGGGAAGAGATHGSLELGCAAKVTAGVLRGAEGTVRYRGPCHWSKDTVVGLELNAPPPATKGGGHAGRRDGISYFSCKQGHGVFVLPEHVAPA